MKQSKTIRHPKTSGKTPSKFVVGRKTPTKNPVFEASSKLTSPDGKSK